MLGVDPEMRSARANAERAEVRCYRGESSRLGRRRDGLAPVLAEAVLGPAWPARPSRDSGLRRLCAVAGANNRRQVARPNCRCGREPNAGHAQEPWRGHVRPTLKGGSRRQLDRAVARDVGA